MLAKAIAELKEFIRSEIENLQRQMKNDPSQ
jgi:predicted DNA-binding transcriptional regulator